MVNAPHFDEQCCRHGFRTTAHIIMIGMTGEKIIRISLEII